jgi:hypothetical protein
MKRDRLVRYTCAFAWSACLSFASPCGPCGWRDTAVNQCSGRRYTMIETDCGSPRYFSFGLSVSNSSYNLGWTPGGESRARFNSVVKKAAAVRVCGDDLGWTYTCIPNCELGLPHSVRSSSLAIQCALSNALQIENAVSITSWSHSRVSPNLRPSQSDTYTFCPANLSTSGLRSRCAACIKICRRPRRFASMSTLSNSVLNACCANAACVWNRTVVSCSVFSNSVSLSARSAMFPAKRVVSMPRCSVASSCSSATLCSRPAVYAMREENPYSPRTPATTITAKAIFSTVPQRLMPLESTVALLDLKRNRAALMSACSKYFTTMYSPIMPTASRKVDRADQLLSEAMIASNLSLSINPYYIYVKPQRDRWLLIGLLALGALAARIVNAFREW